MAAWSQNLATALDTQRRAVLTIGRSSKSPSPLTSEELLSLLIEVAINTLGRSRIDRICVEGGATAAALLKRLGWTRLSASGASIPPRSPGPATPGARPRSRSATGG